jgi:hypothetical protein
MGEKDDGTSSPYYIESERQSGRERHSALAEYHGLTRGDLCAIYSPASGFNHQYVTPITTYKPPAMKP